MSETYLHPTSDGARLVSLQGQLLSSLSVHSGFTAIILISYFLVWRFAESSSWIAQAFFAEDHVGEWLQFACLIATAVYLIKFARESSALWLRAGSVLGALAMFFVAGEEISWGQRLFGTASPEFFHLYNYQGETNLHNMLPLESNILPYYAAAFTIGILMNVVGMKMSRPGTWPFADTFISALIMAGLYIFLPMSQHIYFYEYSELWIYVSVLLFTIRLRKNISEEIKRGSCATI